MNTAAWWWAAGASPDNPDGPSPGPTPGFEIKQSLRFRGGQRLTSNTAVRPPGNFTLSVWCKGAWMGEGTIKDNKSIYGNGSSVTGYKVTKLPLP